MTDEEREKLIDKMVVAVSTHIPSDNVQSGDVFDAAIASLAIAEEVISKHYRARIGELEKENAELETENRRVKNIIYVYAAARAALNGEK